jgi:hypothetical protein
VKQSLYIVEEPQSTDLKDPTSLLNILATGYLYEDSVIVKPYENAAEYKVVCKYKDT